MREQLKWYDEKADNSPWLDALAELRQRAAREGIASSTFSAATNGSLHATQVVFNNASSAIYTDGATATGLKHDRIPFRPRRDLQVPLSIGIDAFENPRGRFSPFRSCCIAAKCV